MESGGAGEVRGDVEMKIEGGEWVPWEGSSHPEHSTSPQPLGGGLETDHLQNGNKLQCLQICHTSLEQLPLPPAPVHSTLNLMEQLPPRSHLMPLYRPAPPPSSTTSMYGSSQLLIGPEILPGQMMPLPLIEAERDHLIHDSSFSSVQVEGPLSLQFIHPILPNESSNCSGCSASNLDSGSGERGINLVTWQEQDKETDNNDYSNVRPEVGGVGDEENKQLQLLSPSEYPGACDLNTFGRNEEIEGERKRREHRRVMNRIAAWRCRRRKLDRIAQLENKARILRENSQTLQQYKTLLGQQLQMLKDQVEQHFRGGCNITLPHSF